MIRKMIIKKTLIFFSGLQGPLARGQYQCCSPERRHFWLHDRALRENAKLQRGVRACAGDT